MKKFLFSLSLLSLMAACAPSGDKQTENQNQVSDPQTNTSSNTVQMPSVKLAELAREDDPICGMKLEDGHIADTAVYKGKVYGFCATHCKDEFKKEPAKYAVK